MVCSDAYVHTIQLVTNVASLFGQVSFNLNEMIGQQAGNTTNSGISPKFVFKSKKVPGLKELEISIGGDNFEANFVRESGIAGKVSFIYRPLDKLKGSLNAYGGFGVVLFSLESCGVEVAEFKFVTEASLLKNQSIKAGFKLVDKIVEFMEFDIPIIEVTGSGVHFFPGLIERD